MPSNLHSNIVQCGGRTASNFAERGICTLSPSFLSAASLSEAIMILRICSIPGIQKRIQSAAQSWHQPNAGATSTALKSVNMALERTSGDAACRPKSASGERQLQQCTLAGSRPQRIHIFRPSCQHSNVSNAFFAFVGQDRHLPLWNEIARYCFSINPLYGGIMRIQR